MAVIRPGLGWAAALLLLAAANAAAQEVARIPLVDVPPGTVGLGAGFRINSSPYLGEDAGRDLVPLYLYEGNRFFARGTEFGVKLWSGDNFTFDTLARYRFNRLEANDDRLAGIEDREQSIDGGLRGTVHGSWGELEAAWLTDLRNRHEGSEFDLTYRHRFDLDRWSFAPWVSLIWQDSTLADYYYGVSPQEARPDRPAYSPGSAFNFGYGLNTTYFVNEQLLLFANAGFYGFDRQIKQSPIVDEDMIGVAYFGGAFLFGQVNDSRFVREDRKSEWSWRVNYGYQAQGNIVGEISTGDFEKSRVVSTNIAGFTASKLLVDNDKVDFYGRLALYRHLEDGNQDNFWSVAPYVMAVGKGYVPWTDNVAFRFGFGLGFSYAQDIPIVEQIKQEQRGRNTSHFLNYLELMADFSIERLAPRMKGCFVGATVVHRSGIFSTSDILGNVNGGSDWITAHLECLR